MAVAAVVLIHLLSATPPAQAVVSTGAVSLLAPNRATADAAPSVASTTPANGASNIAIYSNITITFSEPVDTGDGWYTIACAASGRHAATVIGGPTSYTLNPVLNFANNEGCTVTLLASAISDQDTNDPPDQMAENYSFSFTTIPPTTAIHDIQGAGHISPLQGILVSNVQGIVTAKRNNGFYMQDPQPDGNDATSEGIFVVTSSAPKVDVGDRVAVGGAVTEFRPGGNGSANLTTTAISAPTIRTISIDNPLPPPTIIGIGGRTPPATTIEDDAIGSVETSGAFDPESDGIDFYESLEGMLVQVNNAVAAGPTSSTGEIPVLGDDGANAAVRTARGGIVIQATDFNPERIIIDDALAATPPVDVGDHFTAPVVGVIDYSSDNFKLLTTSPLAAVSAGLARETTAPPAADQLAIATFDVDNLDPNDPPAKFAALASQIVNNLQSPDIVALEEVQDDNGPTNDTVVDATLTYSSLIAAIQSAGGPAYQFRQIDPADDQDGGEPGGNIRVGFLFRTDRGVAFVDRPGGDAITATTVVAGAQGPQLSFSPGRIDPTNSAFSNSRKPLAGEFTFNGQTFFVIANHFNSKSGDQPLFGRFQPPARSSESQRAQQAQAVNSFVNSILAADPSAKIIVLGDLNDFEFSNAVNTLKGGALTNLVESLPQSERYTSDVDGNAQALDHILVSNSLLSSPFEYDIVHVNSEFADQTSGHDPQVARFRANSAPAVSAGGPYSMDEGGAIVVTASGSDRQGGPLTFAWDLDGDGSFETPGQSATFAPALDGPSTATISVRASDSGGLTATDQTAVTIRNAAPSATLITNTSVSAGNPIVLALIAPTDPSAVDRAAGFSYAFDCGDGTGYTAFGPNNSASCPTTAGGTRAVGGKIADRDGGVSQYAASVTIGISAPTVNPPAFTSEPSSEGAPVIASARFSSAYRGGRPTTCAINYGDGSGELPGVIADTTCTGPPHSYADNGSYTVSVSVTVGDGGRGVNTTIHQVTNSAPEVGAIVGPEDQVRVSRVINITAPFDDSGARDTHTAVWTWGDGSTSAGTVSRSNGAWSIRGSHAYTAAGLYTVGLAVTDDDGGVGRAIFRYAIVYDPAAGSLEGDGRITSPAGALPANPTLVGRADFRFDVRYPSGVSKPSGSLTFAFGAAGLNFRSSSLSWLVISGPKAQLRGWGFNGSKIYAFLLTIVDGQAPGGGGVDRFRIKIWKPDASAALYDNQPGAPDDASPTQAIAGGNMRIQR